MFGEGGTKYPRMFYPPPQTCTSYNRVKWCVWGGGGGGGGGIKYPRMFYPPPPPPQTSTSYNRVKCCVWGGDCRKSVCVHERIGKDTV